MKKLYVKNVIIVSGLFILFNLVLYLKGNVIGLTTGDFIAQHALFLDYLKHNFYVSRDLFPQLNMNMGFGESMVFLYYYGLYNPFLLLIYILPFTNILFDLVIIWFIIFVLNSLLMTKLLELNKITHTSNTLVTIIFCFSSAIIFHISNQVMFIYYLPFFLLSLIGLHYFVEKNIKSIYIIGLALVFYTNFFFTPIVSVIQFLYYTCLLMEKKELNIKNYLLFFYNYAIGVLLGMFILIPTFMFGYGFRGGVEKVTYYKFFIDIPAAIFAHSIASYASFFPFMTIMAVLSVFLILKEVKYYILTIPLLMFIFINPLNLFLNAFLYVDLKICIYMIPIFAIILGAVLDKEKGVVKVGIITIIVVLIDFSCMGYDKIYFKVAYNIKSLKFFKDFKIESLEVLILIILIILFLLILKYRNKKIGIIFTVILVTLNFFNTIGYTPIENSYKYNQGLEEDAHFKNYRDENIASNKIKNMKSQTPLLYASLENSNYMQFIKDDLEIEKNGYGDRFTNDDILDNVYLKNYLALPDDEVENVNGIFYGVNNANVCDFKTYQNMQPLDRTFALNQCLFVDGGQKEYKNQYKLDEVYSYKNDFNVPKSAKIDIPKKYDKGTLIINFHVDYNKIKGDFDNNSIKLNGHTNRVQYVEGYSRTLYNNQEITFLIKTKDVKNLLIKSKVKTKEKTDLPFSDLKVYYQTFDDFNKNKIPTINIDNLQVDMNNSYSFDIDMDKNGYLATTIPYDRGFKIYVDGKPQKIERMNGRFIGTKLTQGKHSIKIDFHIVGFNLGLGLSLVGVGLLSVQIVKDFKIYKKNKISSKE